MNPEEPGKAPGPPLTFQLGSKPLTLFMDRDFSQPTFDPTLFIYFFFLAIMGAGFAVVAKHISFLFSLSLS